MDTRLDFRSELVAEFRDSIAQARHYLGFLDKLYLLMPLDEDADADRLAQWGKIADGMLNTAVPVPTRPKVWDRLADQVRDDLSCVVEEYHKIEKGRFPDYYSAVLALEALG